MNKEEAFAYERESREKFDKLYQRNGWTCRRVVGWKNKDYDAVVTVNGEGIKVEEKFLSKKNMELNEKQMLVETMQDTETNDPGWIQYTKARWIIYGYPSKTGDIFYAVSVSRLRNLISKMGEDFEKKISTEGWGRTENLAIPWYILTTNDIARIL